MLIKLYVNNKKKTLYSIFLPWLRCLVARESQPWQWSLCTCMCVRVFWKRLVVHFGGILFIDFQMVAQSVPPKCTTGISDKLIFVLRAWGADFTDFVTDSYWVYWHCYWFALHSKSKHGHHKSVVPFYRNISVKHRQGTKLLRFFK